jgi:hypothetical protein
MITPYETLEQFRSVSTASQQFEIEQSLSTTSQQSITKKQQTFERTNHVLKIRTNVELRRGTYIENIKENNNSLAKAIMGLDLPINTSSTYYDFITELERLPTIVLKEKKTKPKTSSSQLIKLSEYTPTPPPSSSQFPP